MPPRQICFSCLRALRPAEGKFSTLPSHLRLNRTSRLIATTSTRLAASSSSDAPPADDPMTYVPPSPETLAKLRDSPEERAKLHASAPSASSLVEALQRRKLFRQKEKGEGDEALGGGGLMSSYAMYALTDKLAKECCAQAEYRIPGAEEKGAEIETGEGGMHVGVGEGWWYEQLHLPVNFNTWAQVTFLHQYLLLTRLRQLPPESSREWQQQLVNHIFHAAEDRMVQQHRIDSASVRNAYKRDLFYQWRGVIAAYDEGIIGSDAVLATALWRNLFGGREDVDAVSLATVVAYVRRWVAYLDGAGDEDVLGGNVGFGGEERDRQIVLPTSKGIEEEVPESPEGR